MTAARKTAVRPHLFDPDPNLRPHPADLETRGVCRKCHLLGRPGDAHHDVPPAPPDDARSLAAGEHDNEETE